MCDAVVERAHRTAGRTVALPTVPNPAAGHCAEGIGAVVGKSRVPLPTLLTGYVAQVMKGMQPPMCCGDGCVGGGTWAAKGRQL